VRTLPLLILALAAGCGAPSTEAPAPASVPASASASASAPAPASASASAHVSASALYPTPYTAEQIRDATRPGRLFAFRLEVAGKPTVVQATEFTRVERDRAELVTTIRDAAGRVIETRPAKWVGWEDLRKHAEFARDRVTTAEESITVPTGTFRCVVYRVRGDAGETEVFYFAKDQPGPPVLFYSEKGGARVMTSTMIEVRAGR
jgi:hypothetical protein